MSYDRDEVAGAPGNGPEPEQATWPGQPGQPGQPGRPGTQGTVGAAEREAAFPGAGPREGPDGPVAEAGAGPEEAERQLAKQRDEYFDSLLRLQAEFDNYRKRVQRQQHEIFENAASSLVKKLLPVLDTADLSLAHGGGEDVKQVAGALFDILSKEGLERIDPEGQPFDPEQQDAVAHEPAKGQDAPGVPEVSEVLRAGYRWKGQVIRPAMVKVRG
jgi:molecular chaperone GrpE